MSQNTDNLFKDFQALSTADWIEKIKTDLKGADYEQKLIKENLDGIKIKPFYREEDIENLPYTDILPGEFPYIRGNEPTAKPAKVQADICVETLKEAAEKAKDFTRKGVTAVCFKLADNTQLSQNDLKILLQYTDTEKVALRFEGSVDYLSLAKNLHKVLPNPETAEGSFNIDPLGNMILWGSCCTDDKCECCIELKSVMRYFKENLPNFKAINVHAKHLRNAGATAVQELAFGMAIGNEYLARISSGDFQAEEITASMMFSFGIGSDYFTEIAKLRAARLLWSKIVTAYVPEKPEAAKSYFHSETALWNKSAYDAYVNLLRTTTESMSALLGGTDSLSVMPFDISYKKPDAFSERIARNIQIILGEEAKFDRVQDPAAGAYYIECLTHQLAENAWDLFKQTEALGGFIKAYEQGFIQEQVKKTAAERDRRIAFGRESVLGTNQFPNTEERISEKIDSSVYKTARKLPENKTEPLKLYRGAQAFEEMRLMTEQALKTPKVFLLTIGNRAMRTARAGFASNFFGCAGFEIINNIGFESVTDGAQAALDAQADIVVLCSSDAEYDEFVPQAADLLKEKSIITVAGYPKDSIEKFKSLGVNHFIHIKSDILNTLKMFQAELSIS